MSVNSPLCSTGHRSFKPLPKDNRQRVMQGSHMVSDTCCPAWSIEVMRRGESRAAASKGQCPVEHGGEPLHEFTPERADFRPERADTRLGRANFRSGGLFFECTDITVYPHVLQDIGPLGPLLNKRITQLHGLIDKE